MRQNGFHIVSGDGKQCRWEKEKNWPAYQYQGQPNQRFNAPNYGAVRPDIPAGKMAIVQPYPAPRPGEMMAPRVAMPIPSPVPGLTPTQITNIMTGRVFDHSLDDALQNVFGNGAPRR
jgi:hypothetical protein